jgi:hypothetical protein
LNQGDVLELPHPTTKIGDEKSNCLSAKVASLNCVDVPSRSADEDDDALVEAEKDDDDDAASVGADALGMLRSSVCASSSITPAMHASKSPRYTSYS